jgi:glycosyltransferase involved in cell wall biosynthesis
LVRESEPYQLKGSLEWFLLGLAHQVASAIVHLTPEAVAANSRPLRSLAQPKKVVVIPNGLDVNFFSPRSRTRPGSIVRIGMVSRLQAKKDHGTLLDAFGALVAARPERTFELLIAGDGATSAELEAHAIREGLRDRVRFLGTLDRQEVRDLLRMLDIYVHATFGETMSNSIMQAMACGLPIIASDVPGVSNMVTDGVGRLYPSGDVSALERLLLDWIDHPDDASAHGRRALERARTRYDAASTAQCYARLVEEGPERFRNVERRPQGTT